MRMKGLHCRVMYFTVKFTGTLSLWQAVVEIFTSVCRVDISEGFS